MWHLWPYRRRTSRTLPVGLALRWSINCRRGRVMAYNPIKIEFKETFRRKNGTNPGPQLGEYQGELWWYFTVYANYDGTGYKNHIFRWKPGAKAEHVPVVAETVARGDIGVHGVNGGGAAEFSWDNESADFPNLWVQEVPGFVPAPLDSRVDLLIAEVAALTQRVSELEQGAGG